MLFIVLWPEEKKKKILDERRKTVVAKLLSVGESKGIDSLWKQIFTG